MEATAVKARPIPRPLLAVARANFGLVTTADLRTHRIDTRRRSRLLDAGELVQVHATVFRFASHPETFNQRCRAANLAAPKASLSGPTAGRLYGLRRTWSDDVHVLAHQAIALDGVVGHRSNLLGPNDVQQLGQFRVLRPARLACDLSAFLDDADLESVIEQMLQRHLVDLDTVRMVARLFIKSGRNGAARLARVLDGRPSWRRPVDSDLELQLQRALDRRGLVLESQVEIELDSGSRVRIDLADPATRFGVEVDHVTWHGGRLAMQRDKARDRGAMRLGWVIARVTDDDIRHRLERTADELVAIARMRAGSPPAA
jgi:very-short-patch-repair endonuclease